MLFAEQARLPQELGLDDKVKQAFMDILATRSSNPASDPATSAYRRKLYSLLY